MRLQYRAEAGLCTLMRRHGRLRPGSERGDINFADIEHAHAAAATAVAADDDGAALSQ